MSKRIILANKEDYAGLAIENTHDFLLATTPLNPKGQPRQVKRLIRIKRNLMRELVSFNKEMKRFPKETESNDNSPR